MNSYKGRDPNALAGGIMLVNSIEMDEATGHDLVGQSIKALKTE